MRKSEIHIAPITALQPSPRLPHLNTAAREGKTLLDAHPLALREQGLCKVRIERLVVPEQEDGGDVLGRTGRGEQ